MKMTYRKAAFIGLWAGVIFASCSSDEDMITGKTLPQGKYPVAMTVSVESPIARSSVDGTWTNGEKVTVQNRRCVQLERCGLLPLRNKQRYTRSLDKKRNPLLAA